MRFKKELAAQILYISPTLQIAFALFPISYARTLTSSINSRWVGRKYTLHRYRYPLSKDHHQKRISSTWWTWEITSMMASLACMSGLVFILFRAQNRPSTSWRFFISLNATVAVFATAAKVTLLMAVSACLGCNRSFRSASG